MKVLLTHDSVAMGDDIDAPHSSEFTVNDNTGVASVIEIVFHSNYLASIAGGIATWAAISYIPLAVLAQQWSSPKLLLPVPPLAALNFANNTLAIHFKYHTQQDPYLIYDQLYSVHVRRNQTYS